MIPALDKSRRSPLWWKLLFGLKIIFDIALSGYFYYENSLTILLRLSLVVVSLVVFLLINLSYLNLNKHKIWLFHILIIDFLISASYGYVHIGGTFPNHLFIGITALAILLLVKKMRILILTCMLLLVVYLVTMISIDWYLYKRLDEAGYFISCSFIVFAGIVSALIHINQQARRDTLQLYEQLMQSHEQLQDYAIKTEEWAATRERVRIAREIHDTVGHKLTALWVQMQAARKLKDVNPVRSEQIYLECEDLIKSSLQEVRLSVRAIRDDSSPSTSLNTSLQKLCNEFTKYAEVSTILNVQGTPLPLPGNLQLTAYRIVQESLTNAQKHGQAKHIEILLNYSGSGFSLCIRNDGVKPGELTPGFGLINLQERVVEWNGEVRFNIDQEKGFSVEVQFPYTFQEMERVYN